MGSVPAKDKEKAITSEQFRRVRELVDAGGWDAVRADPELSKAWGDHVAENRQWVARIPDRE